MILLKVLRKRGNLTRNAMAERLGMAWGNYTRAEEKGVSIRLDHLCRCWVIAQENGVSAEEFFGWVKRDADAIERRARKIK